MSGRVDSDQDGFDEQEFVKGLSVFCAIATFQLSGARNPALLGLVGAITKALETYEQVRAAPVGEQRDAGSPGDLEGRAAVTPERYSPAEPKKMSGDKPVATKVTSHPDGSTTITRGSTSLTMHGDGSITVRVGTVNKIGIENIGDLAAYALSRHGDSVIHQFRLSSGASAEIVYTSAGEIKPFQFRGGSTLLTQSGDIILSGKPISGHRVTDEPGSRSGPLQ